MSGNVRERKNKDFDAWLLTNVHHVFFPFPINYLYLHYSHNFDPIDNCYYYRVKHVFCLLGEWDCYGYGENEYAAFGFDLLDYKTPLLPLQIKER